MRASAVWNTRHRTARTLVVFSLLGAGCSEAPPPAHCQDEVTAAFKGLETPGLPYRMETVRVYNGQTEFHMTLEFLPPDRRRYTTYSNDPSYTSETIEIGERTWSRWLHQNRGWSEVTAKSVVILIQDSKDEAFACLGPVEFSGKTYIGYRARAAESFVLDVLRPRSQKARQEDLAAIRRMPQPWRTVLLEPSSLLPAYRFLAQGENQFDSPNMSSEHYTYPDDIRIEPPVR